MSVSLSQISFDKTSVPLGQIKPYFSREKRQLLVKRHLWKIDDQKGLSIYLTHGFHASLGFELKVADLTRVGPGHLQPLLKTRNVDVGGTVARLKELHTTCD